MPVDTPETIQAGGLEYLNENAGRRVSVTKNGIVDTQLDAEYDNIPTSEELHGPTALRRVAAPIPYEIIDH